MGIGCKCDGFLEWARLLAVPGTHLFNVGAL